MENASKALIIAGAVLLSIMIVSLLVYTAQSFGLIAKAQQDAKLTQDKQKFNAEYEVYDKKLMYGTDVLSCLNKAQNNNQKYVNYNYYGTDTKLGAEYRQEYLIDVEVKLLENIQETIIVYKLNNSGNKVQLTSSDTITSAPQMFKNNYFEVPSNIVWYYFENGRARKRTGTKAGIPDYAEILWPNSSAKLNLTLQSITFDTTLTRGTYNLLNETNTNNIGKLSALLSVATMVEQTITNDDYGEQTTTGATSLDWYSATWRTAAYDFKTRKFKCTGIDYNTETGYVSKISFEEIRPYN